MSKNPTNRFLPFVLALFLVLAAVPLTNGALLYAEDQMTPGQGMDERPSDTDEEVTPGQDMEEPPSDSDEEMTPGQGMEESPELTDSGNGGDAGPLLPISEEEEGDVILIATASDLVNLASAINSGGFVQAYEKSISEAKVRLLNDINLSGVQFVPIGNQLHAFKAEFDGGGYTIYNLSIESEDEGKQGLFGVMGRGAYVHDLTLTDVNIKSGSLAGGIAGVAEFATISNCTVQGEISSSDSMAGGITGYAYESVIEGCITRGDISAKTEHAGGIAGFAALDGCVITQCESSATVTASWGAGGISGGSANADIFNCSFNGVIICNSNAAGNIVGNVMVLEPDGDPVPLYETDSQNDTNEFFTDYVPPTSVIPENDSKIPVPDDDEGSGDAVDEGGENALDENDEGTVNEDE